MSDALLSTLAEALAELVTAVETSDDEDLDPDTAVKWLENTGHTLAGLGAADRRALDGLFREAALRRPPGPWREELLKVSAGFGLTVGLTEEPTDGLPGGLTERLNGEPTEGRNSGPTAELTERLNSGLTAEVTERLTSGLTAEATERLTSGLTAEVTEGLTSGLTAEVTEATHSATCDAALESARRFATTVRAADPATPVPTCPGWTLADLTRHLGTVHRWAEELVRTRARARVLARDVPLDLPADPEAYPDWLAAGAERFAATAREADPDAPVWSPGADPHVRHYPRHVLFETLVHLADAELAVAGTAGPVDPGTAADAIDHFLGNAPYIPWIAEPLAHLDRDGAVLRLTARDTGAVWTLALGGGGFTWTRDSRGAGVRRGAEPTAGVAADTGELLLLLHRRYPADDPRFTHSGDRELLDDWLAATAL
ncbi:maleylpyruvate isomerase N-terminal domain-containing protein [Streptomyces tanashiensis]|uniref:maleylpyruvate isomerase N-terminal domain-containing protein n=1 Tax=Streptomyces tanashiensis TaxID=67367 RepID=UPI003442D260